MFQLKRELTKKGGTDYRRVSNVVEAEAGAGITGEGGGLPPLQATTPDMLYCVRSDAPVRAYFIRVRVSSGILFQ